jgi:2-methylcitrate dehydratase PrpD
MFENWASPLEIEGPAMGLKQFPCCGSTHPAISMTLALVREDGVRAQDVAKVEILTHPRRLPHTDNPDPRTPLAAKFSIQYAVARALLDGAVRLEHFEGEAHLDPRVRSILAVTTAGAHPEMPGDAAEQFGAEVRVTLRDGRVRSRRVNGQVGRGGDHPMSREELWEKFQDCSRRALPDQSLDTLRDIRDVTRLLASGR